jgi:hypothetical protein
MTTPETKQDSRRGDLGLSASELMTMGEILARAVGMHRDPDPPDPPAPSAEALKFTDKAERFWKEHKTPGQPHPRQWKAGLALAYDRLREALDYAEKVETEAPRTHTEEKREITTLCNAMKKLSKASPQVGVSIMARAFTRPEEMDAGTYEDMMESLWGAVTRAALEHKEVMEAGPPGGRQRRPSAEDVDLIFIQGAARMFVLMGFTKIHITVTSPFCAWVDLLKEDPNLPKAIYSFESNVEHYLGLHEADRDRKVDFFKDCI